MKHLRLLMGLLALMLTTAIYATVGETFTIDNLTYTVLTEDTNTSTGIVSVKSASTSISGDVVIPETIENNSITYTVTTLPQKAFYNCSKMVSVEFPKSITVFTGKDQFSRTAVNKIYINDLIKFMQIDINDDVEERTIVPNNWDLYLNGNLVDTLVIPATATLVNSHIFSKCNLKKVDFTKAKKANFYKNSGSALSQLSYSQRCFWCT